MVDLSVFLRLLRDQGVLFETYLRRLLLQAVNEHSELLVKEASILVHREDRGDALLALIVMLLLSGFTHVSSDVDQIF